jgi:hypothetical protein
MQARVAHILPLTTLRRTRLLPLDGRVIAHMDQKVNPLDVVAEAHLGSEHLMIDVARPLGIAADAADRLIIVKPGENISKGQPLTIKSGLMMQPLPAPRDGRVIQVNRGRILLEVGEGVFSLQAGMPGRVSGIIPNRGVEITFHGMLVQGAWGNGRLNHGMLMPLSGLPDEEFTREKLDISLRGTVLMAGYCADQAVLKAVAELPARGLILGSLSPSLVGDALRLGYPLVVTNGFNSHGMDGSTYKLLASNARREVTLHASPPDRQSGTRPEILIPLPVLQPPDEPLEVAEIQPSRVVRLLCAPHAGAIATVIKVFPTSVALPSGVRAAAAEVRLEGGEQLVVPLVNLEILV